MPTINNFILDKFDLITVGSIDGSCQIGADFQLRHFTFNNPSNFQKFAICQMIFPMTSVGTNMANMWNIDNHTSNTNTIDLAYKMQAGLPIIDTPRELIGLHSMTEGRSFHNETRFCAFLLNLDKNEIYKKGVTYGYKFTGQDGVRSLESLKFKEYTLTPAQFTILQNRVGYLKVQE